MSSIKLIKLCLLSLIIAIVSACASNIHSYNNDNNPEEAAKIYTNLGIERMRLGQYDISLQKFKKALELNKYNAYAHQGIALLYGHLKVNDKARRHYQIALEIKPKDSYILNNYGQFLCEEGNWKAGEKHFLKALANPFYQEPEIAYTNAGLCALKHNHPYQAESYFRKALQKNPKFSIALYQMAELSYKQRHYQQARNYLQRHDKNAKHNPRSLWLRIRVERSLGNKDAEASYALLLRRRFSDSDETQLLNRLK